MHQMDKTDVHLNWFNWLHFLILEGGLLVIVIDCMIFLSLFLVATKMSMSTVSFLAQLDSRMLSFNHDLRINRSLELTDIFYL